MAHILVVPPLVEHASENGSVADNKRYGCDRNRNPTRRDYGMNDGVYDVAYDVVYDGVCN